MIFKIKKKLKGTKLYSIYHSHRLKKLALNGVDYRKFKLFQSHNSRVVFIHIPKAAGMSVVRAIYNKSDSLHASAFDYIAEDEQKFKRAYSFSIVRNPYDRLRSAYMYLSLGGKDSLDLLWREEYIKPYPSFRDFILNGGLDSAVKNRAEHFIPQSEFIFDSNNELVCSEVFRYESLNLFESRLSDVLMRPISLEVVNKTKEKQCTNDFSFDSEMTNKVNEVYSRDFSLLGYTQFSEDGNAWD